MAEHFKVGNLYRLNATHSGGNRTTYPAGSLMFLVKKESTEFAGYFELTFLYGETKVVFHNTVPRYWDEVTEND